jgi:uroporphyrinogen-III synthase
LNENLQKKILVTRPLPAGADFALELEEQGFKTVIAPMIDVRGLEFDTPNLDVYQGLIFTSASAVRFFYDYMGASATLLRKWEKPYIKISEKQHVSKL